jgi:hypothetical protein
MTTRALNRLKQGVNVKNTSWRFSQIFRRKNGVFIEHLSLNTDHYFRRKKMAFS